MTRRMVTMSDHPHFEWLAPNGNHMGLVWVESDGVLTVQADDDYYTGEVPSDVALNLAVEVLRARAHAVKCDVCESIGEHSIWCFHY